MKTRTKIVIAMAVLGAGTAAFVYFQSAPGLTGQMAALRPSTRLAQDGMSTNGIQAGERPWVNQLDEDFKLSYRFRGEKFKPTSGSQVEVTRPSFQFFSGDYMTDISGETGTVTLPQKEGKSGGMGGGGKGPFSGTAASGMPTGGIMKDVTIKMYPINEAGEIAAEPAVTATMDNVTFDNETLRVQTDAYTAKDGREVARDRVPVVVRGRDYDFDGEGLTMTIDGGKKSAKTRGNIERLKIDHAHRLLIKRPDAVDSLDGEVPARGSASAAPQRAPQANTGGPPTPTVPAQPSGTPAPGPRGPGEQPAPQGKAAAAPAGGSRAAPKDAVKRVWRVIFTHDIRIEQGDSVITGERMQVDAAQHSDAPLAGAPATSAPAPGGAAQVAGGGTPSTTAPGKAAEEGVTPEASKAPAATRKITEATSNPATPGATTAPAGVVPVLITWDGPLEVLGNGGDPSLPDRQAVVTIAGDGAGKPTTVRQREMVAQAPTLRYDKLARLATLEGNDASPVVLSGENNSVARTPKLTYDARGRVATFLGPSFVRGQRLGDDGKTTVQSTISWTDRGTFTFETGKARGFASQPDQTDSSKLRSAVMEGDVAVDDQGLFLNAKKLAVDFEGAAGGKRGAPNNDAFGGGRKIKQAHAEGKVLARIPGRDGKPDSALKGEDLVFATAVGEDGARYPSQIVSRGDVEAWDGSQDLKTDLLTLDLAPKLRGQEKTDAGAMRVTSLDAAGHVKAVTDDGTVVLTDRMHVKDATENADVTLTGEGSSVAGKDEAWRLVAADIRYLKDDRRADIAGPGTMSGVKKGEKPGEKDSPFTVTWAGSAKMDGKSNRVEVNRDIHLDTYDANGAHDTATGDALVVNLVDDPKKAGKAATGPAAQHGRGGGGSEAQALGGKKPQSFDFTGNVKLQSLLTAASNVARQMNLSAQRMLYDADKGMTVPAPGQIFFFDSGAGDTSSTKPQAGTDDPTAPSGKGTSAIGWKDSMVYDKAASTVEFTGDVRFAHRPLAPAGKSEAKAAGEEDVFHLNSDRLVATVVPSKPGAGGTDASASPAEAGKVRSVSAYDNVVFTGRDVIVNARQIDFDPEAQVIVAQGTERDPVQFAKAKGAQTGTATYLRFNLKSGMVEKVENPTGTLGSGNMGAAGKKK